VNIVLQFGKTRDHQIWEGFEY